MCSAHGMETLTFQAYLASIFDSDLQAVQEWRMVPQMVGIGTGHEGLQYG